tara:strand:- start:1359 stop:2270 length:912 start_codon:yes stop_codon:yes gene_type:complete
MTTFRGTTPDVFEARQAQLFFATYKQDPELFSQIFNMLSSNKAYEDAFRVSGLGTFVAKAEGTAISFSDPVQGPRRRTVHTTYALGFRVTMEAEADAQYDVIDRMPSDLAESAKNHRETLAWAAFEDTFDGTTYTGLDGLSLVSTAHTTLRPEIGTLSNEISPGIALSETGMESALQRLRDTQDENGRQIGAGIKAKWLVVPTDLMHLAQKLLKTDKQFDSANNTVSVVASSQSGVQDFASPYIGDTNDWWLVANKHGMNWYDRMKLTTDSGRDQSTSDRFFTATYRASIMFTDWRGLIGSEV